MNKFSAILYDTFLDIKSRAILYIIGVVLLITLMLMIAAFALIPSFEVDGIQLLDSGAIDNDTKMMAFGFVFKKIFGSVIFLMVFGSAWLLPSFLGKGRVELTLSKPIGRIRLLLNKFAAAYLSLLAILTFFSLVLWICFSIGMGLFAFEYLPGLLLAFVQFFVVYSIVFCFGILGRSGALAIIGYILINYTQWLLTGRGLVSQIIGESTWDTILDISYHILPKMEEISGNIQSILQGYGMSNFYPVWSSVLFGVVMILISILVFLKRDY